jgi:hypothetical protein
MLGLISIKDSGHSMLRKRPAQAEIGTLCESPNMLEVQAMVAHKRSDSTNPPSIPDQMVVFEGENGELEETIGDQVNE